MFKDIAGRRLFRQKQAPKTDGLGGRPKLISIALGRWNLPGVTMKVAGKLSQKQGKTDQRGATTSGTGRSRSDLDEGRKQAFPSIRPRRKARGRPKSYKRHYGTSAMLNLGLQIIMKRQHSKTAFRPVDRQCREDGWQKMISRAASWAVIATSR
jgi:hypothetical protein